MQTGRGSTVFVVSQSGLVRRRFQTIIRNNMQPVIAMAPWLLPIYVMFRRVQPGIIFLDNAGVTRWLARWIDHGLSHTEIVLIIEKNEQVQLPSAVCQVRPHSTKEQILALLP